jgi:hypothetical protein
MEFQLHRHGFIHHFWINAGEKKGLAALSESRRSLLKPEVSRWTAQRRCHGVERGSHKIASALEVRSNGRPPPRGKATTRWRYVPRISTAGQRAVPW